MFENYVKANDDGELEDCLDMRRQICRLAQTTERRPFNVERSSNSRAGWPTRRSWSPTSSARVMRPLRRVIWPSTPPTNLDFG